MTPLSETQYSNRRRNGYDSPKNMPTLPPARRFWRLSAFAMLWMGFAAGSATNHAREDLPPSILRVGGTSFQVKIAPVPASYVGMTYFEQKVIRIDPFSESALRRKIYLHELMHVAWHQGKLPLDKTKRYTEEEAIQQLVPGLLDVLSQNPQALDYLSQANHPHPTDSIASK